MSRTPQDSPYRDDASPRVTPQRSTPPRPARQPHQPRSQDRQRKSSAPPHGAPSKSGAHGDAGSRNGTHKHQGNGARQAQQPHRHHAGSTHGHRHVGGNAAAAATIAVPPARRRSRRGRRGNGSGTPQIQLTSVPTGRAAYQDTRAWLLKQHGPICAYCAREYTQEAMTLDHVAPRRGQTAYDRRDNLVLACRPCNEAKRDLSPLAYLLAVRARASNLLRYGAHLSPGLLDLARSLMPGDPGPHVHTNGGDRTREKLGGTYEDDDSPYKN